MVCLNNQTIDDKANILKEKNAKLNQTQVCKKHIILADAYSNIHEKNPYSETETLNNTQKLILYQERRKKDKYILSKSFENVDGIGIHSTSNKTTTVTDSGYTNKSRNIMELSNLSLNSNKSIHAHFTNNKWFKSKLHQCGANTKQKVMNKLRTKKKLTMSLNKDQPYNDKSLSSFNKTVYFKESVDPAGYVHYQNQILS
jgi:hypothetical protein